MPTLLMRGEEGVSATSLLDTPAAKALLDLRSLHVIVSESVTLSQIEHLPA